MHRAVLAGILVAGCLICAGCAPKLDPREYGEVIYQLPKIKGADAPYPLPELEDADPAAKKPKK